MAVNELLRIWIKKLNRGSFAMLLAVEPLGTAFVLCHVPLQFNCSETTLHPERSGLVAARSSGTGSLIVFDARERRLCEVIDLISLNLADGKDLFQNGSTCANFLYAFRQPKQMRILISQSFFIRIGQMIVEQDYAYGEWFTQSRGEKWMYQELRRWIANLPAKTDIDAVYLSFAARHNLLN